MKTKPKNSIIFLNKELKNNYDEKQKLKSENFILKILFIIVTIINFVSVYFINKINF